MRIAKFLILLICICASMNAVHTQDSQPATFSPGGYQAPDGALLLTLKGDYVEPYFATKALLAAQDGGLDIRDAGLKWIQWALPRQNRDGRFDRFCRKPGAEWKHCAAADADDSMLALWMQLLYRLAPENGLPKEWQTSIQRASKQLSKLRNSRLHVYHVSRNNHVALFMDNLEVYAALNDVARAQSRFGNRAESQATAARADDLAKGITRVFWDSHQHYFHPSMQKTQPSFYPDGVAQIFPVLAGFAFPDESLQSAWMRWKRQFEHGWLNDKYDPHPWGLVALAAMKMNDENSVTNWLSHSEPLRYSTNWNILEEAVFQALRQHRNAQFAAAPQAVLNIVGQP